MGCAVGWGAAGAESLRVTVADVVSARCGEVSPVVGSGGVAVGGGAGVAVPGGGGVAVGAGGDVVVLGGGCADGAVRLVVVNGRGEMSGLNL